MDDTEKSDDTDEEIEKGPDQEITASAEVFGLNMSVSAVPED